MTDRAVEALARALVTAFAEFDGNRPGVILLPPGMAERALAALSAADKLAIAGITEERLAEVLKEYDSGRIEVTVLPGNAVPVGGKPRRFHRAWAAALLAALVTTPVSDDTEGAAG